jgi:hypothetical protein
VVGYVPLRLMAEPPPRSAREFMKVGESVTLVVDSFRPAKRSVDLAIPGLGSAPVVAEVKAKPAKPAKVAKAAKKATAKPKTAPTKKPAAKAPKKSAPRAKVPAAKSPAAKVAKAPAKAVAAKKPNGALTKLGLRRRRAPE